MNGLSLRKRLHNNALITPLKQAVFKRGVFSCRLQFTDTGHYC